MTNDKLFLSKYVHNFKKNAVVALHHALNLQTIYLEDYLADAFAIFKKPTQLSSFLETIPQIHKLNVSELVEHAHSMGILVKSQNDDDLLLKGYQTKLLSKPSIGIMYLVVTNRCNLRCNYCFLKASLINKTIDKIDMNEYIVDQALKTYSKNILTSEQRKTIILYGGEPLLNFKSIEHLLRNVAIMKDNGTLPTDVAVTINTNATMVTNKILKSLKHHGVSVSVSLDGYENLHDQNRVTPTGKGTFKDTIHGFTQFKDAGIQTGISCTVTDDIIPKLPEITRWFIEVLGADFLGFNPLLTFDYSPSVYRAYFQKYSEAMIESYMIARKFGCYEDRMMRKVEAYASKSIYPFDCAACGKQLVISPDGQVGVCHAYLDTRRYFTNTKMEDLSVNDEMYWLEWCKRSPLGMEQCLGCEALGICGGGCPYNADITKGSIWSRDEPFCVFSKIVLEWMIWDVWENREQ